MMHYPSAESIAWQPRSEEGIERPGTTSRRAWMKAGAATLAAAALQAGFSGAEATSTAAHPLIRARLSLNENAYGCSSRVTEALRRSLDELNRYTESAADELIEQIAAKEDVSPQQIILGNVLSPLGILLGLAGGPGGEFIYSEPGFTDLVSAAQRAGGVPIGIPLDGQLKNDLHAIASALNARTRAVYLVNPHNPSGTVHSPEVLKSFVRDISAKALVVIDEAYLEYMPDLNTRSLVSFVRDGGNALVVRTFDKIYGLARLQFGYAIAPVGLAQTLQNQGIGANHTLNGLAVIAASAALQDARFVSDIRIRVEQERERWNVALDELKLHHTESHGSFVFFDAGRPQSELAAAFLSRGIDIGRSYPPLHNWVRISIGLPRENTLAITALHGIVKQAITRG